MSGKPARTTVSAVLCIGCILTMSHGATAGEPGPSAESSRSALVRGSTHTGGIDGHAPAGRSDPEGCDAKYCQLYGLYMPTGARLGDTVGLSMGYTHWNIGIADCQWAAMPDGHHPFIVLDLFRLARVDGSFRFEQIGQSWVRHGFYALGNTQCGGSCAFEPGHNQGNWLGQGCTNTTSIVMNVNQNELLPRYDVNPWTGEWYYPGSHDTTGPHSGIEHRLQVHDADLDPAQNPGALYFSSSYAVLGDDVNAMNSAGWKPVTVSGVPGGMWTFGMSGAAVMPEAGHAIDGWTSAQQTLLAPEIPVVEFESPDGRCILAAAATPLAAGTWHYEYALMNIDLSAAVGAFSIPVAPMTQVTNTGFHAVEHHEEEPGGYSNDPWTLALGGGAVSWQTVDNPTRWGTLYNFRFDADRPPDPDGTIVSIQTFVPIGIITEITGETIGPCAPDGDMDGDGEAGGADLQPFVEAVVESSAALVDICPGDFDGSGIVDLLDVPGMVGALLSD